MKLMTTIATSAVVLGLLAPAALPAGAETVTLKRTGAQSRTDRATNNDESGAQDESAADASAPADQNDPADSSPEPRPSDTYAGSDTSDEPAPRASKRRLIIGYDRTAQRVHRRRHCVESFWSSRGERERTLWIME